jgi:hypothetical protein
MLNLLAPVLLSLQPIDTTEVYFSNISLDVKVSGVDEKNLISETRKKATKILAKEGYLVTDSSGFSVYLSINKIETPTKNFLLLTRKDYIIETEICIGSGCYIGTGRETTYTFGLLNKVQNPKPLLNEEAFYKALDDSLRETSKFDHKKNPD